MKKDGIFLKKGKEAIFAHKNLWIFSGAIADFPDNFQEGDIYPVYSHDKELLGYGYFHSRLSLAGRIVSFGSQDPWKTIFHNMDNAISLRNNLFDPQITNAYRLVNAEGDQLPGFIIDQYADYLVLQSNTLGADTMKKTIIDYLLSKKRWKGIFEKSQSSSREEEQIPPCTMTHFGTDPNEIEIKENSFRFMVDWKQGQKTGFFLDQRDNRSLIYSIAHQRRILNCFSYTGGFTVYALKGLAKNVDSIDISSSALALAEKNLSLNNLETQNTRFIKQDVFRFLRENPLDYDIVILDPPAFVKKKKDLSNALAGYREINLQAIKKMPKNSFLLTCSCSHYVTQELFQTVLFQAAQSANRTVKIIRQNNHGFDHPINIFQPESLYLKSFLLSIE
ncbi:MAG: class I SAM-dependent rRNA methyltransferase [Parachlamydiales bacterium]|nr:class I SAM-dependent rRNA methyltransferase [Parachlamydiales bacterium]